jgi:hypothetical protein
VGRLRAGVVAAVAAVGVAGLVWAVQGRGVRYGELAGVEAQEVPAPVASYRLTAVGLTTTTGRRLQCLLREPAAPAAPHSRMGVVLLGGIGTGRRAVTLVAGDFPGCVLACDYPWGDPSEVPAARFLARLPALRGEVVGTPGALRVAASYLLSRSEIDAARVAAVGVSLGVPAVSAWAGGDPRVRAVALVMGGADLRLILDANLRERFPATALRAPVAALLAALLRPLEPGRTVGGIAPRPLLVVGAPGDTRIPRRSTEALFAAAREPKRLLWLGRRHVAPRDTALLREITDSTFAWVSGHLAARP